MGHWRSRRALLLGGIRHGQQEGKSAGQRPASFAFSPAGARYKQKRGVLAMETNAKPMTVGGFLIKLLQGVLIGLGAVLPGISGGVLCVVFGVYAPMMALLSNPFRAFKRYALTLLPVVIGMGIGFLGVSKVLGILLETYPDASVCLFVGLIVGMLPSLFREARSKGPVSGKDYVGMAIAFAALFALLLILNDLSVEITPNFGWYLFCGFCLAMSVIAPGMSFSTLLMPLGLYTPFVKGIGDFDFGVLIPGGIGALLTVILLAKGMNYLLQKHHSMVSHVIIGIILAATLPIIPFAGFVSSVQNGITNALCLLFGVAAALLLDRFNRKVDVPDSAA
jgi:predicted membrane protein